MIIKDRGIAIYFGDSKNHFYPKNYNASIDDLEHIANKIGSKHLTFLQQVHGTTIHLVDGVAGKEVVSLCKYEGDALIASASHCGIGVMSADCLPIIFYDVRNRVIAIAHAGWRGSVAGIVPKVVHLLKKKFAIDPKDLLVYFGPAAGSCCYEVQANFVQYLPECLSKLIFFKKNKKFYFDNNKFNILQLLKCGVIEQNICLKHNFCTICNKSYHSYRRNRDRSGRQATVVIYNGITR